MTVRNLKIIISLLVLVLLGIVFAVLNLLGEVGQNKKKILEPDSQTTSVIFSNILHRLKTEKIMQAITVDGSFVFTSFPVYNADFSRLYGYPASYVVASLPDDIAFISYDIKYFQISQKCTINILFNKQNSIFLPKFNVSSDGGPFLPERSRGYQELPYQRKFRINHSAHSKKSRFVFGKYRIIGEGLRSAPKAKTSLSLIATSIRYDLYSEYVYVSLGMGCSELPRKIFQYDDVYLEVPLQSNDSEALLVKHEGFRKIKLPKEVLLPARNAISKINN